MALNDRCASGLALARPLEPDNHARRFDHAASQRAAGDLLRAVGADVNASSSLEETPRRVADAYAELLTPQPFRATTFPNDDAYDELILARAIPLHSLCIHHLLPFYGEAHVGHLPGERVAGWLERELEPKSVGVVLEAEHLCMSLRGVQKLGAKTVTSALRGRVRDDARTSQEFSGPYYEEFL